MDWITTGSIFVILITISLIFFIFTPKLKVFFDCDVYNLDILEKNADVIEEEFNKTESNSAIIPIYGNGEIKNTDYPKIYDIISQIPNIKYAGIIILKPRFEQVKQYGYYENADNTLRYFYCIKHSAAQKSGIWIDGEKKFFYTKELICGDMSRENSLFNKNKDYETVVLFLDIDRNEDVKKGRSPNTEISNDEILSVFNL
jgi:hypothetical protein